MSVKPHKHLRIHISLETIKFKTSKAAICSYHENLFEKSIYYIEFKKLLSLFSGLGWGHHAKLDLCCRDTSAPYVYMYKDGGAVWHLATVRQHFEICHSTTHHHRKKLSLRCAWLRVVSTEGRWHEGTSLLHPARRHSAKSQHETV